MIAKTLGATVVGIDSHIVTVEADVSGGMPQFGIVGLPDSSVKESRERVSTALKNSGISCQGKRITVNLAPGDIKKAGPLFDLPIAAAVLGASGGAPISSDYLFAGELSLDGNINAVKGVLPIVFKAREEGVKNCVIPYANRAEASVVDGINIYAAKSLNEVISHLRGDNAIEPLKARGRDVLGTGKTDAALDYDDVKGQELAKRAFAIAAAGRHNILAIGPPGTGKTMMARRLPTIMPPLTFDESVEITKIFSVRGLHRSEDALVTERPFRITHHTISRTAMVGGGAPITPGEVSLAHTGVLFLDEIAEYPRSVLEALRQPLEDKQIIIGRIANNSIVFPADFMLVAASNPCPCGNLGLSGKCRCSESEISNYMGRISGALMDRIDMHVELAPVGYADLSGGVKSASSAELREGVSAAINAQAARFAEDGITFNGQMRPSHIKKYCALGEAENKMLELAYNTMMLSARARDRILRLARTIADLSGADKIESVHLSEAIGYRNMDRALWGK